MLLMLKMLFERKITKNLFLPSLDVDNYLRIIKNRQKKITQINICKQTNNRTKMDSTKLNN
jgi:hypothetical protein